MGGTWCSYATWRWFEKDRWKQITIIWIWKVDSVPDPDAEISVTVLVSCLSAVTESDLLALNIGDKQILSGMRVSWKGDPSGYLIMISDESTCGSGSAWTEDAGLGLGLLVFASAGSDSENNALFAGWPLSFIPRPDFAQQFLYAVNSLSFRESNDSLMILSSWAIRSSSCRRDGHLTSTQRTLVSSVPLLVRSFPYHWLSFNNFCSANSYHRDYSMGLIRHTGPETRQQTKIYNVKRLIERLAYLEAKSSWVTGRIGCENGGLW